MARWVLFFATWIGFMFYAPLLTEGSLVSRLRDILRTESLDSEETIIHTPIQHTDIGEEPSKMLANPASLNLLQDPSNRENKRTNDSQLSKQSFGSAVINVHHFTQFLYEGSQIYVYSAKLNEEHPEDARKWSFFYVPVLQPVRSSVDFDWVWTVKNEVRLQLALGNAEVENATRQAVADRFNENYANYSKYWVIAPLMIDMLTGFVVTVSSAPAEGIAPFQLVNPNSMIITFRFACSNPENAQHIADRILDGEYNVEVAFHFAGLFEVTTDMITITGNQLKSVVSKTVADGGNTNATYIHRSQGTSFVGMYMANVRKMIYTENGNANTSYLMNGLQEEFKALFQQGLDSATQEKIDLGTYEQVWQPSDLNPDLVTSELNKLFTYNKSYTEAQNDSNNYFSFDRDFAFSSSINSAVSASGWGFQAGASFGGTLDIQKDDSETKHNIVSQKRIDDLLAQQSVETEWTGTKVKPKSFKVFRLTDITDRLQIALVAKQLIAEKANRAITRLVAPLAIPGNSLVNFLTGEIKLHAGTRLPNLRWLFCNGSFVKRIDFPRLFAVIGFTYGRHEQDDSLFQLPDLRGRVPIGADSEELRVKGLKRPGMGAGNASYTLTVEQLPPHEHNAETLNVEAAGSHSHAINDPGHNHGGYTGAYATAGSGPTNNVGKVLQELNGYYQTYTQALAINTANTGITINNSGGHGHTVTGNTGKTGTGQAFSVLPPVQAFHFIIYAGE